MKQKTKFTLPVGYHTFHPKQLYNFQFNRWHSLGFARYEDMQEAGKKINNFTDWKNVMTHLAETAEDEGRLMNAAIYYRGAEFYITQHDPDKLRFYNKFITLFYQLFTQDNIERFKIPYKDTYLPALKVPANTTKTKGTIVMHGGFDSFIEEFYSMIRIFSDNGYDIIAFEGPGQGGARRLYGLPWDQEWDKPTKAILDYFKLHNVTLFGISMGGHLCLRAAAFDPRIKRVVTSGGAIDYWKIPRPLSRGLLKLFLHFENFTTKAMIKKMKKDEHHNWFAENAMYITKINNPLQATMKIMDMTKANIHPQNITQDILILSGRNDHFIPIKMHNQMKKTLNHAQSIKGIIYTKETHAQNHCQIGNIPLVCTDILTWINEKR